MKATEIAGRFSDHANAIRGLAAVLVVTGHVRGFFLQDFQDLTSPTLWDKAIYLATGLGHQAVMVFFVLSGFLVGGSALRKKWSWGDYLSRRFLRLYVVLLPALLLTALVDQIALRMPNGPAYYLNPLPHFNNIAYIDRMTWTAWVGNLFFTQNLLVPVYGCNSPLWSLAYEFWYYLLFPLMVRLLRGAQAERLICGGILAGLLWWLPGWLLLNGLVWLMGVAVRVAPQPRDWGRWMVLVARWLAGGVFIATLLLARLKRIPEEWSGYAVGLGFAVWFYFLFVRPVQGTVTSSGWYTRAAAQLAGCSYSLYAMHLPLVILIRTSVPAGVWAPGWISYSGILVISLLVGWAGYVFSMGTEAHTDRLRQWAERRWALSGKVVPA
jgi:peptidoglycan/LPS O-acetylase OafA/YrhL